MPGAGLALAGVDERAAPEGLPAEVRGVDALAENSLVHRAQPAEREHGPEKTVRDLGIFGLDTQAVERVGDDVMVIEGEPRQAICREPGDVVVVVY